MPRASALLTSNFSNTTGFAWKFFHRLQNAVARELHGRGVGICLSFATIDGEVRTIDPDIPSRTVPFDLARHSARELGAFLRFLRDERVRYAYFTDYRTWSPLFPLMRLAGVRRFVVHDHISVPDPYLPPPERGLRRAAKLMLHRLPGLSAQAVYACSTFVKERLARRSCPADRITVIHHGIDLDRFAPGKPADSAGPVHIVLIARAVSDKGVQVLLDAAGVLLAAGEDRFRISYGGDGPELDSFRRKAALLGIADRVDFLGALAQTQDLICRADVVVVPSIWGDAAPLSVLEGMAGGKPLVVTDVGGIPEQIGSSGCAIIVPPADAGALAKALGELIRDPERRGEMGRRALARAQEAFSEDRFHREVVGRLLADFGLR
jgi:glycosyltransferase involved in cell wall biosynthesis